MIPVHRERKGQRVIPVHRERKGPRVTQGRGVCPAPKVFKAPKATRVIPVHRDRKVSRVREVRLVLLALKVRRVLLGPSDLRVHLPLQQAVLSGYVLAMGHKYVGVLAPAIAQIRLSNFRSLLLISITQ